MADLPLFEISGFEIVLDQIVNILIFEELNQQQQAINDGKDPADYSWNTDKERYDNLSNEYDLTIPLVNVWYESSSYDPKSSLKNNSRIDLANYNIDIYCSGSASQDGLVTGLTEAAKKVNRVVRQIYFILANAKYNYTLGLPVVNPLDGKLIKFISNINFLDTTKFQPVNSLESKGNVVAARMRLQVKIAEPIPDGTGVPLQEYFIKVILENGTDNFETSIDGG